MRLHLAQPTPFSKRLACRPRFPSKARVVNGRARLAWQVGFSLVELLLVMAIASILIVGGSLVMGNRQSGGVRAIMDELEGAISNAQQAAIASGRDVALVSWGAWGDGTFRIAFGDATLGSGSGENFTKIGEAILEGNPPATAPILDDASGFPLEVQQTVVVAYHYSASNATQKKACLVDDEAKWLKAMGDKNDPINDVDPFKGEMKNVLDIGNNFCKGVSNPVSQVLISGYTKRFSKTAFVKVVATGSGGAPLPNGPMGLIVLMENGASIYKFYNPGAESGDGKWRRI